MSLLRKVVKSAGKLAGAAIARTPQGAALKTLGSVLTTARRKAAPMMPGVGAVASVALPAVATIGAARLTEGRSRAAAAPRRRRSKGISGSEMKAFRRVTNVLGQLCKTPAPTRRRTASKGRSCR
jgi:hypothetical protein